MHALDVTELLPPQRLELTKNSDTLTQRISKIVKETFRIIELLLLIPFVIISMPAICYIAIREDNLYKQMLIKRKAERLSV